jgi:hypothetical protein
MKLVVEFYRTRQADDAHAVVGREAIEAGDLADAIQIAHLLSQTLDLPQRPDAIAIADLSGAALFSGVIDAGVTNGERPRS